MFEKDTDIISKCPCVRRYLFFSIVKEAYSGCHNSVSKRMFFDSLLLSQVLEISSAEVTSECSKMKIDIVEPLRVEFFQEESTDCAAFRARDSLRLPRSCEKILEVGIREVFGSTELLDILS